MAWLTGYTYRRAITIESDYVDADLTNFPVSVLLSSSNFDFSVCLTSGYDVVFTSSDEQTLLTFEREYFDKTNSKAKFHVKIPSVSNTTDTVIYVYYGKADDTEHQNASGVWDSNYLAVFHLTDSSVLDSTANNNDSLSIVGTSVVDSTAVGKVRQFTAASTEYIRIPQANLKPTTTLSLTALACHSTATTDWQVAKCAVIGLNESGGYGININDHIAGSLAFTIRNNGLYTIPTYSDANISAGYRVFSTTADGRYNKLFVDGSLVGTADNGASYPIDYGTAWDFLIGADPDPTLPEDGAYFDGFIGEIRVSGSTRTAEWVKAEAYSIRCELVTVGSSEQESIVLTAVKHTTHIDLSWS